MIIGSGMFMWDRIERTSSRYGVVYLTTQNWFQTAISNSNWNPETAKNLVGKKVKITCKVLENRKAEHYGDLFLKLTPTTPEVGETVVLGVGQFNLRKTEDSIGVSLVPSDGREKYFFEPKILYHLIEQTVEMSVEETDEEEHPAPVYEDCDEDTVISLGDGYIQTKGKDKTKVFPEMEKIDNGLFLMHNPNCAESKGKTFKAR